MTPISNFPKPALSRFVVIYRGIDTREVLKTTEVLRASGFDCFEVSLTTSTALESIRALNKEFGTDSIIGAGTVRSEADVEAVHDAGARLILSPETYEPVIKRGGELGMHVIPGAYTATEVATAQRHGADTVKIFPAGRDGVEYFRLLREPLPNIPLLVTGGVTAEAARGYFTEGAVSVGVGVGLLAGDAVVKQNWTLLAQRAEAYRNVAEGIDH